MTDESRELGVDLSDVEEDLEDLDYPIEQDELLEEYGEEEIDMGEESATLEELLASDGLYAHLWGVQAGEIDELPQEFIERAQRRQARTEVDVDADDD